MRRFHFAQVQSNRVLALKLTAEWRYDSRPPASIEENDLALVTGIRLEYP